jgi:hypothetical protein
MHPRPRNSLRVNLAPADALPPIPSLQPYHSSVGVCRILRAGHVFAATDLVWMSRLRRRMLTDGADLSGVSRPRRSPPDCPTG